MLAEARSYLALPFPIISDVSTYNFIIYSIVNQRSKREQRVFLEILKNCILSPDTRHL